MSVKFKVIIALLVSIFLLSLVIMPTLAATSKTTSLDAAIRQIEQTHRPPPNHILSPELANSSIQTANGSRIQPMMGNPNYYDYGHYGLGAGQGYYYGAFATISPKPVIFDHDWWTAISEYWVQITARKTNVGYAEVGLDVQRVYIPYIYQWVWVTQAYAAYSEDPNGYGTVFAYYSLPGSLTQPATATVATFQSSGNTWSWYCNGQIFATQTFSNDLQCYVVDSTTEAYNQPGSGYNGVTITYTSDLAIRSVNSGLWVNPGLIQDQGISSGWMVGQSATDGTRYDWSTRS